MTSSTTAAEAISLSSEPYFDKQWALYNDASLSEVKDKLLSSVTKLSALDGKVATGGMLNAYNAVTSN